MKSPGVKVFIRGVQGTNGEGTKAKEKNETKETSKPWGPIGAF
jgi:hypothetical protein